MRGNRGSRIAIWDWAVRICHWLFVLLIPLAWWTAEQHMFDWHLRIGILLLTLLLFRLIWGLIGSSTARFSGFLKGPGAVLSYVRGDWPKHVGHNPLGGWSVAALLLAMLLQVGLGLFATDEDGIASGPLNHLLSYEAGETVTELHELNFNLLLGLIVIHVGAILYYALVKKDDLVRPMVSGVRQFEEAIEPMRPASRLRLILAAAAASAITWWIATGAPL